ncbi:hypothetical protein [Demequina sp.]|uniref:TY-Chap2 family putative peptide chaperone n=1 Tax=Demequina sp. TaxID=2050685 RepID=UPI0025C5C7A1|nr:hypothetical protein [Demequina sp.]
MDPDEDDEIVFLSPSLLLAQAWAVIAGLSSRHPDLVASHVRSDGDVLYIVHDETGTLRLQFDLTANLWFSGPEATAEPLTWPEVLETLRPSFLIETSERIVFGPPSPNAGSTRRSESYACISQILDSEIHSERDWTVSPLRVLPGSDDPHSWEVAAMFPGATANAEAILENIALDVQLMGQRVAYEPFWLLECDLVPTVLIDTLNATAFSRSGAWSLSEPSDSGRPTMRSLVAAILDSTEFDS